MPKLAVLAPRSCDFMDNSNAPIQFNVLNKQLIGKLWNMWDGLYFNYIKVPKMFCRVNGWLSIIHRSGSWKMFEFQIHKISKMFAMWMVANYSQKWKLEFVH
jgi:hypothetical protein